MLSWKLLYMQIIVSPTVVYTTKLISLTCITLVHVIRLQQLGTSLWRPFVGPLSSAPFFLGRCKSRFNIFQGGKLWKSVDCTVLYGIYLLLCHSRCTIACIAHDMRHKVKSSSKFWENGMRKQFLGSHESGHMALMGIQATSLIYLMKKY